MTVKVLEHNGIYTAYRRVIKRSDNGQLYESVKRIDIFLPPPDKSKWPVWVCALTPDELDVGLQVFFDKWNFGRGTDEEGEIYQYLHAEKKYRRDADNEVKHPKLGPTKTGVQPF